MKESNQINSYQQKEETNKTKLNQHETQTIVRKRETTEW